MVSTNQMIKQVVDFNKNAFDTTFNNMMSISEQNEKMFRKLLDQATWIPEEGRNLILQWAEVYRKGFEDFKKTTDENYKRLMDFLEKNEQGGKEAGGAKESPKKAAK